MCHTMLCLKKKKSTTCHTFLQCTPVQCGGVNWPGRRQDIVPCLPVGFCWVLATQHSPTALGVNRPVGGATCPAHRGTLCTGVCSSMPGTRWALRSWAILTLWWYPCLEMSHTQCAAMNLQSPSKRMLFCVTTHCCHPRILHLGGTLLSLCPLHPSSIPLPPRFQ